MTAAPRANWCTAARVAWRLLVDAEPTQFDDRGPAPTGHVGRDEQRKCANEDRSLVDGREEDEGLGAGKTRSSLSRSVAVSGPAIRRPRPCRARCRPSPRCDRRLCATRRHHQHARPSPSGAASDVRSCCQARGRGARREPARRAPALAACRLRSRVRADAFSVRVRPGKPDRPGRSHGRSRCLHDADGVFAESGDAFALIACPSDE